MTGKPYYFQYMTVTKNPLPRWFSTTLKQRQVWVKEQKDAPPKKVKKRDLSQWEYIRPNMLNLISWIFIDVDIPPGDLGGCPLYLSAIAWENIDLQPNLIIVNPDTGHAHIGYYLSNPVRVRNDDPANRLLKAVQRGLTIGMGGDQASAGTFIYCPFNEKYIVTSAREEGYSLSEIFRHVGKHVGFNRKKKTLTGKKGNRNTTLFEKARKYAYHINERCRSIGGDEGDAVLHNLIMQYCIEVNSNFEPPLTISEVTSVARSVSKWTISNCYLLLDRSKFRLDPRLPVSIRQMAGAMTTNLGRTDKSRTEIINAYRDIVSEGGKPTQQAVSDRSKLSLSTVKRHWAVVGNGPTGSDAATTNDANTASSVVDGPDIPALIERHFDRRKESHSRFRRTEDARLASRSLSEVVKGIRQGRYNGRKKGKFSVDYRDEEEVEVRLFDEIGPNYESDPNDEHDLDMLIELNRQRELNRALGLKQVDQPRSGRVYNRGDKINREKSEKPATPKMPKANATGRNADNRKRRSVVSKADLNTYGLDPASRLFE